MTPTHPLFAMMMQWPRGTRAYVADALFESAVLELRRWAGVSPTQGGPQTALVYGPRRVVVRPRSARARSEETEALCAAAFSAERRS
jgi:hypothetical protein